MNFFTLNFWAFDFIRYNVIPRYGEWKMSSFSRYLLHDLKCTRIFIELVFSWKNVWQLRRRLSFGSSSIISADGITISNSSFDFTPIFWCRFFFDWSIFQINWAQKTNFTIDFVMIDYFDHFKWPWEIIDQNWSKIDFSILNFSKPLNF